MAVAVAPTLPFASPSTSEAAGLLNLARQKVIEFATIGTLSAVVTEKRYYFECAGYITRVQSFRRSVAAGMGAADSTDVDVNLNGTSILAATKMEHEFASGSNSLLVGVLDTAHAAYVAAAPGIAVVPGDYLEVQIDAIEAGATAPKGLYTQVTFVKG